MTNRRQPFIINLLQMLSTHAGPINCLVIYVSQPNTSGLVVKFSCYRTFTLCSQLVLVSGHLGPKPFRARAPYVVLLPRDILVHHYSH